MERDLNSSNILKTVKVRFQILTSFQFKKCSDLTKMLNPSNVKYSGIIKKQAVLSIFQFSLDS